MRTELTVKQEDFAVCVGSGMTLTEAYRTAYDAENMAVSTIHANASRLMDNQNVAVRVRGILDHRERMSLLADAKHVRFYVFERLMVESTKADNPAAARLKALELLGKVDVVSMFTERREVDIVDHRSSQALEIELREKLKKYANIIDVDVMQQGQDKLA